MSSAIESTGKTGYSASSIYLKCKECIFIGHFITMPSWWLLVNYEITRAAIMFNLYGLPSECQKVQALQLQL